MNHLVTGGLTAEEETELIRLLRKVGQPWGECFYNALAPLVAVVTVEVVCLWRADDGLKALLIPRPDTDEYYPGQMHSPGTVLRASDTCYGDAVRRVLEGELGEANLLVRNVEHRNFVNITPRGTETPRIYVVGVPTRLVKVFTAKVPGSGFFPVSNLPANTISHHKEIIRLAVESQL